MTRNLHASRRSCNLPTESRLLVLFLSPIANTKPAPKFLTVLYFPKAPLSKVTINYAPMQLFQRYCQKPATMHSTQWKYQNSAQIQYVFNFFPLLNSPSIPLPITLPFSIPKAVPSLKHTFFSRQMCMHCLLTFTTVFLAAWCALVFLNSPYRQFHFIMFTGRPQCFWFALWTTSFCMATGMHTVSHSLFPTNSFILSCLSRDHGVSDFFPLPMISFCHDYQQASMFLIFFPNEGPQFVVFTGRPQQCGTWECSQISFQFWKSYFLVTVDLCAC